MLMRRKLCAVVLFAAIVILMLASQTIQRRHLLSLSLAPPLSRATPSRGATEMSEALIKKKENRLNKLSSIYQKQKMTLPCGCADPCVSELGASRWFGERFDPQQQPVLLSSSSNMDGEALRWWLGLQRSNDEQTLEEVMSKMFRVISPPTLDLRPRPSRCRSCAVVGNSGNLRHSRHGGLIDSHSSVIRMNKAVTRGFEEDVGNRTTHHFLYPESAVDVGRGVSLVLLPFKLRDLEWLTSALSTGQVKMTYMRVRDRVQADKDKVLVVNPVFFKYVHDRWTEHHGRYPSTGMLALVFALHTCDQVSVFGYGADQQGNWHHYWEENRYAGAFRKTGVHNADFETQIIQRLAKEGKISLHL
uniref:CMP-N-acetylneuraminate-beta-galactosamide-alpha-2,3-sialyltransferase 2 n=1 Tax=Myripristis murdjan TaxID=586833 RepID=A0A667XT98_9TELE